MRDQVKVFIVFMLVTLSLMGLATYIKSRNDKKEVLNQVAQEIQGTSDFSQYPVVQNIAPTNAFVGLLYRYDLGIMDIDTHYANIRVTIEEGPSWLEVENLSVLGVPTEFDIETSKVTLKISDGEHSTYNTFYILVTNPDESE